MASNPYDSPVGIALPRPGAIMATAIVFSIAGGLVLVLRCVSRRRQNKSTPYSGDLHLRAVVIVGRKRTDQDEILTPSHSSCSSAWGRYTAVVPPKTSSNIRLVQPAAPDPMAVITSTNLQTRTLHKVQYIFQLLEISCYYCVKRSVIFYYRNIFVLGSRSLFHWVTTVATVAFIVWWLAYTFVIAFDCGINFNAHWTALINLIQNCSDLPNVVLLLLTTDLLTDMLVRVLPIPIALRLPISNGGVIRPFLT